MAAPILLPDISHWQVRLSRFSAAKVKRVADAIQFKATEATTYIDPNFQANCAAASSAGLPFGAYHFVRPGDGALQARFFWAQVTRWVGKGLICVLMDWEDGDRKTAQDFLAQVKRLAPSSVKVGGYFGAHARENGGGIPCDWTEVPAYGGAELSPSFFPGGKKPDAWQYTDGRINGTDMPDAIDGIGPCDVAVVYNPEAVGINVTPPVTFRRVVKVGPNPTVLRSTIRGAKRDVTRRLRAARRIAGLRPRRCYTSVTTESGTRRFRWISRGSLYAADMLHQVWPSVESNGKAAKVEVVLRARGSNKEVSRVKVSLDRKRK